MMWLWAASFAPRSLSGYVFDLSNTHRGKMVTSLANSLRWLLTERLSLFCEEQIRISPGELLLNSRIKYVWTWQTHILRIRPLCFPALLGKDQVH